jgi:hypothetical protein
MSSWISVQRRPVRVFRPQVQQNNNDTINDVQDDIKKSANTVDSNVKRYIAGGKLGDFIYQLSVIKYNYDNFVKKGILYLSNIGDPFTFSLEKTYEDTKDLIMKQPYIEEYTIYNNQKYDINLSRWRNNIKDQNELNWIELYKRTFDINWGKNIWLDNIENDTSLNNTILISHSQIRYNDNIDFNFIENLQKNKKSIFFICFDINEYNKFLIKYNVSIPVIICKNIMDMAIKVNSCKLLIGNLSSPISLSLALHKNCIGILPTESHHYYTDVKLNSNLNFSFYIPVNNNDELQEAINRNLD